VPGPDFIVQVPAYGEGLLADKLAYGNDTLPHKTSTAASAEDASGLSFIDHLI
jgi:hypothetical protein